MKRKRSRSASLDLSPLTAMRWLLRQLAIRPWLTYLGCTVLGLACVAAVITYQPSDLQSSGNASANLLGPAGAWLAGALFEALGQVVYPALCFWFIVLALVWRAGGVSPLFFPSRNAWRRWLRVAGWVLLVPWAAAWCSLLKIKFGLPAGAEPGGALGGWLVGVVQQDFPVRIQAILMVGGTICAVALCAEFVLRWIARSVVFACKHVMRVVDYVWTHPGFEPPAVLKPQEPIEELSKDEPIEVKKPLPGNDIPIRHQDVAPEKLSPPVVPAFMARPAVPIKRPTAAQPEEHFDDFELPPLTLLDEPQPFPYAVHDQQLRERAALLEKTFADFSLNVRVVGINTGPVITQYEVALETGLRVNKITNMGDDLALNLKVPSVRIVAPIPGKNTVGIEVPNETRAVVRLKEVILTAAKQAAKAKIPLFLGKDTEGSPLMYDLAEMPHLLIAGRTGTGKSVCMNAIILSILMTRRPDEVKMVMIDPKMLEMSEYGKIPHLMHPVVKDMKKAEAILSWAVDKMEERYDILCRARVRNIAGYNELSLEEITRRLQPADEEERSRIQAKMPYIIIFVDEMNDLMMTMKKEVEGHIIRLAQKSRAAGLHLVVATQKPTVDVITGLIKSNLPARICFQVSSRTDSRVVLDEMGADKLLGKGDMLFLQPGTSTLIRAQGAYASDQEITRVVENLECEPAFAPELMQLSAEGKGGDEEGSFLERLRARDDVYEQAIEVVIREGRGSVSLLQRALGIGYGRGARLIDFMAEDGIVGNYNGSQAREVLYTPEQWEELKSAAAAQ